MHNHPFARYWGSSNPFETLCRKFVLASILYYLHDFSAVEDSQFDNWAVTLKMKYSELPVWFTIRVSRDDLAAGTGFTLVPTEEEREVSQAYLRGDINPKTTF